MFLKRLETIGFKSFAERIQMDFVSGVTAVVGPNGSGKSNVIDAIRWLLGEQSAKSLRGQKMEDIIFQGSDTRNALNFAEASLILNNEEGQLPIDYQEVDVTRRVYRSGESEFFLNKQACRMKDIIDLFMDTGLGKESFSIIGQGRIDEILSSKAEERRAVFEEAAGVLKYKQRKKKAEFKLLDTSDNLDRVEDILHEITEQLAPLEKQAATARKYKAYQKELRETEVSLLVTEIEQLHEEWQLALKDVENNELKSVEQKTAIQKKDAKLTENREYIDELDRAITSQQKEYLEVTEQLKHDEGERNVLLEQAKHEQENRQKLLNQQQNSEQRLQNLNRQVTHEKEQLDEITAQTESIEEEIQTHEKELQVTPEELDAAIEELKSAYIDQSNEEAVEKNELKRLDERLKNLDVQRKERAKTYALSEEDETRLLKEMRAVEAKVNSLKQALDQQDKKQRTSIDQLEKERERLENMQQKLASGHEQIARLASRKEMLEEMKDDYQGFYYGAKEILKAKNRGEFVNIFGAVIDLIQIPNRYITAMETILGAQAQHIVVENDESARNGINWLKRNHKGRATFLPLQSIIPKQFPARLREKLSGEAGFIGVAAELIETDKSYDRLRAYLLGNVLVADNIEHANQMAVLTNRKFRIVTLKGDVVFPGGSMSGGAKKKNSQSLFTREKEISDLKGKLDDFTKRKVSYEENIAEQKEKLKRLDQTQQNAGQQTEAIHTQLEKEQDALHQVSLKHSRAVSEVRNHLTITDEYQIEQNNLHNKQEEILKKLEAIQEGLNTKESEIEQLSSRKQTMEQDEKSIEQQLQTLKISQAEREERRRSIQERYELLQSQYEEESDKLSNAETELTNIMDEAERRQLEQSIASKIKELNQAKETISNKLEQDRTKRETLMQQIADEEHEVKGMQHELNAVTGALHEKEVQANRLDVTLENHLNRLQTYKMTYERARTEFDNVSDVKDAKEQVEVLTNAIERLGTVNLGAIDEYERLSEREAFLREQQKDLLEAKETLYNVIQEMDEEMTKRFSDVFEEIQSAFSDVFQTLFGGGHASLSLTDPQDLLETGIEIAARPPGKKLKTLELLSGGERALTAIALLFAILHVRPVPFCILDEVDAALDEANIERFGKYLQSFSEDTQFIVITHRKGTMEEADALYGVTMQESGVSRLVSVKLEEAKPLVGTI